jgi:hypothetical protein
MVNVKLQENEKERNPNLEKCQQTCVKNTEKSILYKL